MSNRLTRITTGQGDKGMTRLANQQHVKKSHPRIEAIGTVDELNAVLGMLVASIKKPQHEAIISALKNIQNQLFSLGGELASPSQVLLKTSDIAQLEAWIKTWNQKLPPLKEFVIPGACVASAKAHFARCVARRAERRLVALIEQEEVTELSIIYLNRLSDLLFIISRMIARTESTKEAQWQR
ncbi:cob(I)yrinic acid a,c-diamide adenosyltransferase [Kangiella koreensis]|uniref:Corrinoid adenosyltransferase n=1 Tax=Kangiella koreensis (strain DSM 16069 / JCM 12317 / KCTC 12182 / SW-125) TaxID=523791 RepID=C7RCM3_KANKD|nr:cob(I)yrinic acid a,c-diamide adenosyltransferase [Kangiella koreensis]ACV27015.1 ATP/cobalamin adenosyltransferase [Kangiella koreensis DSM 16069]